MIHEVIDMQNLPETTVLVGITRSGEDPATTREHLDELAFLIDTAGGIPGKRFIQRLAYPDPRTYVGSGKLTEISEYLRRNSSDLAVFDDELSPSQIRNIEKTLRCRIIDRNNLILDIFARRARTSTAKTQVELAQCEYLLPRLTRRWTHLEKQRGGIGLRGPGEQGIETDRRYLRWRIKLLKQKLKEIDKQKTTQRKNRSKMVRVALVGYTNAGKSTLDEVRESDILLHVVDISHPDHEEQIGVVSQTLADLGASGKVVIMVFNKIDRYRPSMKDPGNLPLPVNTLGPLSDLEKIWIARENTPCVFISALHKTNCARLREVIYQEVRKIQQTRWPESEGRGIREQGSGIRE